jgi:hypothetical protein
MSALCVNQVRGRSSERAHGDERANGCGRHGDSDG